MRVPQRRTEHMQSEHTAGQAQFVEGIFVLTEGYFSTAVVPAGIFREGEQPAAMTCNQGIANLMGTEETCASDISQLRPPN